LGFQEPVQPASKAPDEGARGAGATLTEGQTGLPPRTPASTSRSLEEEITPTPASPHTTTIQQATPELVGHEGDQEEDNHPGEGWVRWNPSWCFAKTEVLQEGSYKWKGAKYQKFLIQDGDPKVFSTMGKGKLEYGKSLHPAPSWRIFPWECKEEDLEKFQPEHCFQDQSLIRGVELVNDNGIFAEMYRFQASAVKKKYLDLEQEQLSKEAQALTNKWVELDRKRRNVKSEIRQAKKYLTEAQALERIKEAYDNRDPKALVSPGEGGDWLMGMGMGQRYHLPHTPKILENCHYHGLGAGHTEDQCHNPHNRC
jgi:hypothetical protein